MTVEQLTNSMKYDEFLMWFAYFDQRPLGWREDDRAAKMIQAQGVKEKPWRLFSSLDAIYNRRPVNEEGTDMASLKGSEFMQKMLKAKGGEVLSL